MELVLIRHGLPVRSAQSADPPLHDEGHDQSRKVAQWLAGETFDAVYSSPMLRAIETAAPLLAHSGHELRHHDGIAEFDRDTGA